MIIQNFNNGITLEITSETTGVTMFFGSYKYTKKKTFTVRRDGKYWGQWKTKKAAMSKIYQLGGI